MHAISINPYLAHNQVIDDHILFFPIYLPHMKASTEYCTFLHMSSSARQRTSPQNSWSFFPPTGVGNCRSKHTCCTNAKHVPQTLHCGSVRNLEINNGSIGMAMLSRRQYSTTSWLSNPYMIPKCGIATWKHTWLDHSLETKMKSAILSVGTHPATIFAMPHLRTTNLNLFWLQVPTPKPFNS